MHYICSAKRTYKLNPLMSDFVLYISWTVLYICLFLRHLSYHQQFVWYPGYHGYQFCGPLQTRPHKIIHTIKYHIRLSMTIKYHSRLYKTVKTPKNQKIPVHTKQYQTKLNNTRTYKTSQNHTRL